MLPKVALFLISVLLVTPPAFAESEKHSILLAVRSANRNPDSLPHQFSALKRVYPIVRAGTSRHDTSVLRSFFNLASRGKKVAPEDGEAIFWYAVALGETANRRKGAERAAFLKAYLSVMDTCLKAADSELLLLAKIHLAGMRSRALGDEKGALESLTKLLVQMPKKHAHRKTLVYELNDVLRRLGDMEKAKELLVDEGASPDIEPRLLLISDAAK